MIQDDAGFSSRVSLNAVSNILRTAVVAATGLMMVPFYIGELGFGAYAVVFLATSVSLYFASASEAVSQAFTRHLALSMREEGELSARVFSTVVSGMLRCVLIMLVLCIAVSASAPYMFDIGQSSLLEVQVLFVSVLASGLVMALADCLCGVFVASNRLYVSYVAKGSQVLLQALLAVTSILALGPSLAFVGASSLASSLVCLAFVAACVHWRVPGAELRKGPLDRRLMTDMGGLGAWSLACEVGTLLFINASLIVANVVLGNDAQATFSIAANVSSMIGTVSIALAATAVPLLYKRYSEGEPTGVASRARLFMKASGVSMAFVLAYLAVFAPQAIGAWIGPGHDDVAELVRFLMPAEVVLCAAGPLTHVPVTFMRLRPAAVAICLLGAANVIGAAAVMAFTGLGVLGACMVWSLTMLALKMAAYPVLASRMTGCSAMLFIRPILLSLALFAASAVALWGLSAVAEVQASILSVALPALALFPAYAVLAVRFAFDRDEKLVLASFLPEKLRRPAEEIIGIRR